MTTWLTVDEGAHHIRAKSSRLIREAIKAGDLPAYRYGRNDIRVRAADLDDWLENRPWEPRASA